MEWPAILSSWLMKYGINPETVSIVVQTGDVATAEKIERAMERELGKSFITPSTHVPQARQYCGLNIEVRRLPDHVVRLVGDES